MSEPPNLNTGKPWSDVDVRDLRASLAHGASIDEAADFLCRTPAKSAPSSPSCRQPRVLRDNLHTVAVSGGILCIHCIACGHRAALTKVELPAIHRSNMTPLSSLRFRCARRVTHLG
jgi:hypothetical protein